MLTAALFLLAAAAPQRGFAEERALLDRRLETLRRLLPDAPTAASDVATLREMADAIRLQGLDAVARPPVETGTLGYVAVDLTAAGRYSDLDRFFRQIALHPRPIDVESLSLKATPEELVRVTAVVRFPFRPARARLPAAPQGARAAGAPRASADAYLRDQALALAKSEALAGLRRTRRNPRLFLSELAAIARDRPVVFTEASLADEFVVRGLTVGEAPSRDLEARFERGFFRMSEFLMARQGACRRFEARGKSPVAGPDAELPLPAEDPFRQDETPCRVDRDAGRGPVIQLGNPVGRGERARGPATLRLRDVDLADLFFVLHQITGRAFLVDGDVSGRVGVDAGGVSLDDVYQALRKAGLRLVDVGPLTRVMASEAAAAHATPASLPASPAPDEAAPPEPKRAGFELKREGVREILAVMTDIDASLAALGPAGFLGRASLWIDDAPLDAVRAALLDSAGLQEHLEDDQRVVRRGTATDEVFPIAGVPPDRRLAMRPEDVDVLDFELAGLATSGDGYVAFAYVPTGRLHAYRAGDRLADAVVRSISSTDVELETDEGRLRLPLPPLSR